MADLGAIGYLLPGQFYAIPSGKVSGTVTDATGTPARRRVLLYRRSDGAFIDEGYSYYDGTYSIACGTPYNAEEHFVVALDDDAGTQYNAVVLDKVLPV